MAIHEYKTRYGTIYRADGCKDDYANMVTRPDVRQGGRVRPYTHMTLQKPAMDSIRAVEKDLGGPWQVERIRVTGSIRTCELQSALYASNHTRYAHPSKTLHTHGLAIDVHTGFLNERVRKSLLAHGWHQSRPDDEPWHFSFRLTA
jgi:hypothetical protein